VGAPGSRGLVPHQHGGRQRGGCCRGNASPARPRPPPGRALTLHPRCPPPCRPRRSRCRRSPCRWLWASGGRGWLLWMLLVVGAVLRPSADGPPCTPLCRRCKIPPQDVGPPPLPLGAGPCHLLKGSQTPGTAEKNAQLVENTHFPTFPTLSPSPKPIPLPFSPPVQPIFWCSAPFPTKLNCSTR